MKGYKDGRLLPDPMSTRDKTIRVRFTKAEREGLSKLAQEEGMSLSQCIRNRLYKQDVTYVFITHNSDLARLASEVNKLGVNVNQIARNLNANRQYRRYLGATDMEADEVKKSLNRVADELSEIKASLDCAREEFRHDVTGRLEAHRFDELDEFWNGGDEYGNDVYAPFEVGYE